MWQEASFFAGNPAIPRAFQVPRHCLLSKYPYLMKRQGLQFPLFCMVFVLLYILLPLSCPLCLFLRFRFICRRASPCLARIAMGGKPPSYGSWHLMKFDAIWGQRFGTERSPFIFLFRTKWIRLWKSSLSKRVSLKGCWNVWRMRHKLRMTSVKGTVKREWGNGWTTRRPVSCLM